MERRRLLPRVSSASLLRTDLKQSFGSIRNQPCRPASASSFHSGRCRNKLNKADQPSGAFKPDLHGLAFSNLNLSSNVRKAVAIATKQTYRKIQEAFYRDLNTRQSLTLRRENRAELSLERFLEKIRHLKSMESSLDPGTERLLTENKVESSQKVLEGSKQFSFDKFVDPMTRAKYYQSSDKKESGNSRPRSASLSRGSTIRETYSKESTTRKTFGTNFDKAAESVLERRDRIRNRSLHIEQHVVEARERIRKARNQKQAEIEAITAVLQSNRIGERRICDDAVLAAKYRISQWRADRKDSK